MKKIDVLIVFEHRNRELESAVRISKILKQNGYTCEIVQSGWNEAIAQYKWSPRTLVVPWCYDDNDLKKWLQYKGQNNRLNIVNLHCEQLTFSDAIEFTLPQGEAKKTYHCSWGNYFTNNLLECGVESKTIIQTGSPRLDFFKPFFQKAKKEEHAYKFGLNPEKKWVFFVGNFSQMYLSKSRVEELEKRGFSNMKQSVELATNSFEIIVDWIKQILNDNYDFEYIYRPHPSEKINHQLNELEKTYKNFHVIKEEEIRKWYQICDVAFVWCSTSSVEAAYSGIPVFSLRPIEFPDNKKIELVELLDQIKSYNDLKILMNSILNGDKLESNRDFLNRISFYYGEKDTDACKKTSQAIIELFDNFENQFTCKGKKNVHSFIKLVNACIKIFLKKLNLLKRIKKWEILNKDIVSKEEIENLEKNIEI